MSSPLSNKLVPTTNSGEPDFSRITIQSAPVIADFFSIPHNN